VYLAANENEETFNKRIFYASQTIRNHPRTFEIVQQSVIRRVLRALIHVEGILSSCCELLLDKQQELNSY
jgi:hypothetical protein